MGDASGARSSEYLETKKETKPSKRCSIDGLLIGSALKLSNFVTPTASAPLNGRIASVIIDQKSKSKSNRDANSAADTGAGANDNNNNAKTGVDGKPAAGWVWEDYYGRFVAAAEGAVDAVAYHLYWLGSGKLWGRTSRKLFDQGLERNGRLPTRPYWLLLAAPPPHRAHTS